MWLSVGYIAQRQSVPAEPFDVTTGLGPLPMPLDTTRFETPRQSAWPWRAGLVVNNPQLADEIAAALSEVRAACVFQVAASAPIVEIFALIERDSPDLLFVELSATSVPSIEWMASVQNGDGSPMDGSPMVV